MIPSAHWPVRLTESMGFRFRGWVRHLMLSSGLYDTHVQANAQIHTHATRCTQAGKPRVRMRFSETLHFTLSLRQSLSPKRILCSQVASIPAGSEPRRTICSEDCGVCWYHLCLVVCTTRWVFIFMLCGDDFLIEEKFTSVLF